MFPECLYPPPEYIRAALPALDLINKFITFALLLRLQLERHVTVLATSARLFDEFALNLFAYGAYRFPIGDLRFSDRCFNTEFTFHPVNQNFEMQLTHSRNNGLPRLLIGLYSK